MAKNEMYTIISVVPATQETMDWLAENYFDIIGVKPSGEGGKHSPTHIDQPDEVPNTPDQESTDTSINEGVTNPDGGTSAYNMGEVDSINNLSIPADALRSATISGPVQNGATITNDSSNNKYITIDGTQTEPVDVNIISTEGAPVYIRGDYNDIYLEGSKLPVSSSKYPNVSGVISVADTNQPVSVTANFRGDDCGVNYLGTETLTIADGSSNEIASPIIYAPNATVEVGGKYDTLTATVSPNTLNLKNGFHANKLIMKKGNIFVNGVDINDFVDELVAHKDCKILYPEYHADQDNTSKLMGSSPANGKIILDGDVELTKGRAYSVLASGKEILDLNGHTWKCGDTRATESNLGSYYIRGSKPEVTVMDSVGGGLFENNHHDYLFFVNSETAVLNVKSGEFRGYTHTLYSLLGTINVYGGTFKLLDADTAERDQNGNLKFLLNCYDANYTAGTAKINVYGGKFYEFNPAETYGEPGGPVSYVAPGYKVIESLEDGKKVFEVVPESTQVSGTVTGTIDETSEG